VNPGSEPERDDTGLPPIDIEIPDDARELERDVLAYQRELKAQRRRSRSSRMRGLLTRNGIAMPLLACCLIFALITGTLLTVFTASGIDQGLPGAPGSGKPGGPAPTGSTGVPGAGAAIIPAIYPAASLPTDKITVANKVEQLRNLRSAAFLLVPRNCGCAPTLAAVATLMTRSQVTTLLVAAPGVPAQELKAATENGAALAADPSGALRHNYPPVGLTAVLVARNGTVHYADRLVPADNLAYLLWAIGALRPGT
jgi:hypothetical protein